MLPRTLYFTSWRPDLLGNPLNLQLCKSDLFRGDIEENIQNLTRFKKGKRQYISRFCFQKVNVVNSATLSFRVT